jgi:hypothetical protein
MVCTKKTLLLCRSVRQIYVYILYICSDIWVIQTSLLNLDDWLTVHHSIILVDLQLDAQNSYLFTHNTFIKILYMFRALPCSSSGGVRRNCVYAASVISTGAQDSHLQRVTIPEAAYIQGVSGEMFQTSGGCSLC